MPRFTPMSKFRLLALAIVCLVSVTTLVWPAASLWVGFSQSKGADSSRVEMLPDALSKQQQRPNLLARLLTPYASRDARHHSGSKSVLRSQIEDAANLLAPTITATKVDSIFTNVDGDGRADPGDTLQYTITINNTSGEDASGVKISDPLDANLTLVGGTVNTSPIAFDDTVYTAAGNVRITIPDGATDLVNNDIDPDTQNNAGLTAIVETKKSVNCAACATNNVSISADGSFSYDPPPGFTGTDTFTYTVRDVGADGIAGNADDATGTGTATFNVSGMIWFINAASGTNGDGRLNSPFNCLRGPACFDSTTTGGAADDPGDNIFLYSGSYTGGLTLLANQRLIGQGAGASLSTITGITPPTGSDPLPSTGGARPSITTTAAATSAITVGSGNTLRGFNIGDSTAVDITGTSFGTLTISEMTLSGTGRLLNLTTGTLAATIDSLTATTAPGGAGVSLTGVGGTLTISGTTAITTAGGQGITISGSSVVANFGTSTTITDPTTQGILVGTSTGNISFGNTTVSDATDSISLTNNSAGTRSFGTITTTNGTGIGFLHTTGGGLVTVSGATSISNPGGRGIDIQNSTTAISFGAANVTSSGGTGVNLQSNSANITFGDLDISPDAAQRGLHALSNTATLTTTSGVITSTTTGVPVEIVGVSAGSRTTLAMVLETVNANGAGNGIVLTSTSGTFAVNGTGTTLGSGGTIQNITNRGASFIDANGITLKNMNFTNVGTVNGADPNTPNSTCGGLETGLGGNLGCNAGLHLVNVTGATFDRVVLNGGAQQGVNMNNVTTFAMSNSSVLNFGNETREDGFRIKNLLGTNSISSTTVTGNEETQMRVVNTSGTLTAFNITGSSFSTSAVGNGVSGIQFEGSDTAVMNINVSTTTMSNNAADGFFSSGTDNATVNITVNNCTIQNNLNAGINVSVVEAANGRFTITNNATITGHPGSPININLALPSTGTLQGTVSGNTIGTAGVPNSGSSGSGDGVRLISNGSGTLNSAVTGNTIHGINFGNGIHLLARDGNSVQNTTITGNTINVNSPVNSLNGIFVESGAGGTDAPNVCADIGGAGALANNIANNTGIHAIRVRNVRPTSSLRLPGYAGSNTDTAAMVTYLTNRNIVNGDQVTVTTNLNVINGGGACTQPARLMADEDFSASLAPATNATDANAALTTDLPSNLLSSDQLTATAWQPSLVFNDASLKSNPAPVQEHAQMPAASSSDTGSTFLNHVSKTTARPASEVLAEVHNRVQDESLRKPAQEENDKKDRSEKEGAGEGADGSSTVNIGGANGFTLPAGKSVTVTFRATVDNPQPAITQVSNQATISGSNFTSVVTDDSDVAGANQPTVTLIDNTTVAVTSNANPSVFGQNVTFTATMTGVPSRASDPPGTVQFKADGNNIGSPIPVVAGTVGDNVSTAQASISSLSVGTHVITAEYSGGGSGATGYNANIGTLSGGQLVGKASTTTGVTSSQNPSVFGQQVTFTATIAPVAPGTGAPTGTVNFLDGGNPIASCQNVSLTAAQATCQTSALVVGNHTISVSYGGDGNFNTSNGNMTGNPQVVNKAGTSVGLTSSQNPSVFGQAVTFTASLAVTAPGAGTPTGTVSFLDGGNPITGCTNVAISAGQAQCQPSSLSVGNHTITAAYSGDANFNTSNASLTGNPQVVNKAGTSVGLTTSVNPSVFGQSVNFTATLGVTAPGAGTPTGTVQFLDGGNPITGCTSVAISAGQAVCGASSLAVGNHTITAAYSGDGNFNTSNGSMTGNPQVVNKAATTVGLTSSLNPSMLGQQVTFTATLAVTAPGAGTPSGTANFLDGGNPIAGCQNVAIAVGQATCQTSALTGGNHTITVQYSGDGNFNSSTGSLTGNPQVVTTSAPALIPTVGLTRTQGSPASNSQVGTVSDDVSSPGSVTVTVMSAPTGINVTNIVNTNGTITANIEATCSAATGNNTVVLEATDGKGLDATANLVINVAANTAPTLGNYANQTIVVDCKLVIAPDAAPADNGSVASVMAAGSGGFTGTISVDAATGVVTVTGNGPVGMHTITVTATDNCGMTFQKMFTVQVVAPPTSPNEYDFDNDRKADVAVYRAGATSADPSYWYILRSSDNMFAFVQFGNGGDVIVPGDYDGDGDTEVAIYRPSNNFWYTSTNPAMNYGAFQWGSAGDIPVPGFYDADNKTDIAVWRPSMGAWYIAKSTGGMEVRTWGQNGDKLVPADYDGDTKTDLGVWRPSDGKWYIQLSGGGTTVQAWGATTDVLVPADYDGDGEADLAVFRPSTGVWLILQSTGGTRAEEWGEPGDVPAPGDFDNDGKADLTVYRPSDGTWYIFRSCPCTLKADQFGITTDKPVSSAYNPPVGP